jgi:hypothetical protein
MKHFLKCIFEIDGYGCVLPYVQNYYPVEKDKDLYCWGFKYNSGIFEFFYYRKKAKAEKERQQFINVLEAYWLKRREVTTDPLRTTKEKKR